MAWTFFLNQGQQEHSKLSGKSRSYTKEREERVFSPSVPGYLQGLYCDQWIWPMGLVTATGICIRQRKILSLFSDHDHTRLQEAMSTFYTSLKICLMFPSFIYSSYLICSLSSMGHEMVIWACPWTNRLVIIAHQEVSWHC